MSSSGEVVWTALDSERAAIGLKGTAQAIVQPTLVAKVGGTVPQVAVIAKNALTRDCMTASISHFIAETTVSSFSSVSHCNNGQAFQLGLIILYLRQDEHEPLELIRSLRSAHSHSIVFLISDDDYQTNPDFVRAAWRLGARGFVSTKTTGLTLTLSAIRFVHAGGFFAPVGDLLSQAPPLSEPLYALPSASPLTARETVVLRLLKEGKTNKMIAQELLLSSNTVKVHVHNILKKMHVSSRAKAAMIEALPPAAETGRSIHVM